MEEKEVDYSTIRIKNALRIELDSLKLESESYSVVIARLIEENKKLKGAIDYLKEDKAKLYKLALASSDSVALVNDYHRITYFISLVINDISMSEEDKLQELKLYLKEPLEKNPSEVLDVIDFIKEMLISDEIDVLSVLVELEQYIRVNAYL